MRWFYLLCVLVTVHAKTELELNVEQNVDNCFTETFGFSESSWNNINAQESFVKALQNCLKVKNMLQISDDVLINVNKIAGNLTLEARNVNQAIARFDQFSESFFTQNIDNMRSLQSYILSASKFVTESFVRPHSTNTQQTIEIYLTFLKTYVQFCSQTRENIKITFDNINKYIEDNVGVYAQYLSDYTIQKEHFEQLIKQKDEVQQLILQDALSHVNARLTRQRFDANCIPGQPWLICTNDFQHIDECYRPARIYHNNQIFAVNSSIEIAEPSFCSPNELCIYTPRGFRCSTTGSEIPNVVYHSSSGFGRAYDVLHRYGMFDISFFTLNKLKRLGVQEMQVEQLGTIDHEGFNQYIFEMYDQLE